MYINEILTVLIITLGLGESETITWTGESSNDWDDSEKYFFLPFNPSNFCTLRLLMRCFICYSWDKKVVPSYLDDVCIGEGSIVSVEYGEANTLHLYGELSVVYMVEVSVSSSLL